MNRPFGSRARALAGSEKGFTLIEVLVSALVVTLIAGAVAGGLMANIHATADQHARTAAQALAEQDQERLKGLSAAQLDNLIQTYTSTIDGTKYTVTSKAWYLSSSGGLACSSGGGSGATYFKTISTVSDTVPSGAVVTLATDESVITPPAGGGIMAQIHDQTASPLQGVSLSASGPESDAGTSDANGCVIFSALQTGNYNLSFTDTGYVDPNGNASPIAATASVASTGFAAPSNGNPVEMGQGGGIIAPFKVQYPVGGTTYYNAKADGLAWLSPGGAGIPMASYRTYPALSVTSPSTVTSGQTSTASGTTSTYGLFPFVSSLNPVSYTNNYQVWAGRCLQEQPPAGTNMFSVAPGSNTTSQAVLEPVLLLTTTYQATKGGAASSVVPTDVKVTFTSDTGSGTACSDTWTFSGTAPIYAAAGPSNSYVFGLPFASSATTGSTASSSGQTGTIKVCADYKSGSTYYKNTTSPFTDSYSSTTSQSLAITYATTGKC